MTEVPTTPPAAQSSWRRTVAVLIVVALVTPPLAVAALDAAAWERFERYGTGARLSPADDPWDAFQHAYASGVMASLFGDDVADLARRLVELVEQNECIDTRSDLFNNAVGREMALALGRASAPGWRDRLARTLGAALHARDAGLSIAPTKDARLRALCASG